MADGSVVKQFFSENCGMSLLRETPEIHETVCLPACRALERVEIPTHPKKDSVECTWNAIFSLRTHEFHHCNF